MGHPKAFSELRGGHPPAELHLLAKHLIDASADLFVSQELPPVELLQASCHLLAEPCVMIDVVLHKLLDIFLRAALALGSGPLHFRLQLRRKMHFHISQTRFTQRRCQGPLSLRPYRFSWMKLGLRCTSSCTSGESPTALKL